MPGKSDKLLPISSVTLNETNKSKQCLSAHIRSASQSGFDFPGPCF